jgi:uncharacterized protein YndB with AHSA1/START domain
MTHDSSNGDSAESITVECDLDAPPEKVWRALTDPQILAAWLAAAAVSVKDDGRLELEQFELGGSAVELTVLSEEHPRLLRYRWQSLEREGTTEHRRIDSVVTFELGALGIGGTRLRILHDGFREIPIAAASQRTCARRSRLDARAAHPQPIRQNRATTMRLAA